MFITECESVENAWVVKIIYGLSSKKWAFKHFDEMIMFRSKMEHFYFEKRLDTLKELMS